MFDVTFSAYNNSGRLEREKLPKESTQLVPQIAPRTLSDRKQSRLLHIGQSVGQPCRSPTAHPRPGALNSLQLKRPLQGEVPVVSSSQRSTIMEGKLAAGGKRVKQSSLPHPPTPGAPRLLRPSRSCLALVGSFLKGQSGLLHTLRTRRSLPSRKQRPASRGAPGSTPAMRSSSAVVPHLSYLGLSVFQRHQVGKGGDGGQDSCCLLHGYAHLARWLER